MRAYKPCHGPPTGFGVHFDFDFGKAPDRPPCGMGDFIKLPVFEELSLSLAMPVIAVGLDNEFHVLEYEVGLKSTEHRLMHLELEPTLLELPFQGALNGGILPRKGVLSKPCLPHFLTRLVGVFLTKVVFIAQMNLAAALTCCGVLHLADSRLATPLPQRGVFHYLGHSGPNLLYCLRRAFLAKPSLTQFLAVMGASIVRKHRLASLLNVFRALFSAAQRMCHMFNYNTPKLTGGYM